MNKRWIVFVFLSLFSFCAFAQEDTLSGAVSFKKEVKEEIKETKEAPKFNFDTNIEKTDTKEQLAKTTKHISILDNPRFAKMNYARLNGIQKSVEKVQQKKIKEAAYTKESEKEQALEELENQALVQFDDYKEKPEDLQKKINENPRESIFDMTSRLSYYSERNEPSEEHSKKLQEKMEQRFQDRNGISMDEYMDAFKEQTKLEQHQRVEEDEKAETFPVLNTDKNVEIEKVDEQNALLHVSVGAPRSKKE
ncbi:MAG: hypothetical protein J6Y03_06130 [Alphaproteobacteria bacterium]|nr:hypothetical protein [Alphaproteobacteria bacterium]